MFGILLNETTVKAVKWQRFLHLQGKKKEVDKSVYKLRPAAN
ncbi:hypothetical protein O9992_14440 [Vibrio lentus]|nr:hypothetical protein [Vibrio lentus]